jgi:glycosyltransferase involved in cell wall biosynthesis
VRGEPFRHEVYTRPSSKSWRTWLLSGNVARKIESIDDERKIDLLHGFAFFPVCFYAMRFRAKRPRPVVLTHHDLRLFPSSRLLAGRVEHAIGAADLVTCLCSAQRDALAARGIPLERMAIVPNGAGGEAEARWESPLPEGFVLFAGRIEEAKGIHLLLDAYEAARPDRRPPLVIAGDGKDADRVRKRASSVGATMVGWIPHDRLLGLISRAKAVLVPSFAEASPLVPLEAYARGVPVIIHDLPEISDSVRDESGAPIATLVPRGDRARWTAEIERAIAPPELVDRARIFAETRTWPQIADRYSELYVRLLGK